MFEERKVNTMKYETPEMTPLGAAINAVHNAMCTIKYPNIVGPDCLLHEGVPAYEDWE
jgi:hypothetical protein